MNIDQVARALWAKNESAILTFGVMLSSVAALRALPRTNANYATTRAYYAGSLKGGSVYKKDATDTTTADDGGFCIVSSDGSRWKLVHNGEVSLRQFGVKADGTGATGVGTDDTARFQAAINWVTSTSVSNRAVLTMDGGIIRLTSSLVGTNGMSFKGIYPRIKDEALSEFGFGTFLYFDHTGKGFNLNNDNGYYTDIDLSDFAILRNQPTPTTGWAPNDHDYDIYTYGVSDIRVHNVMHYRSLKGVRIDGNPVGSGGGRLEITRLRGQFFQNAIRVDAAFDVVRIDQLHAWPFWQDNANVHLYCLQNLDVIMSGRNDNPLVSNIFSIFHRSGIRFFKGTFGTSSKFHLVNADIDIGGKAAIWVDPSCDAPVTGQFENVTCQGETTEFTGGVDGLTGVWVEGTGAHKLQFGNLDIRNCAYNAVRVDGVNTIMTIGSLSIDNYNLSNVGYTAVEAATGSRIDIASIVAITNGNGAGTHTGNVRTPTYSNVW